MTSSEAIFFDARMFGHSGIGRYVAAFAKALSKEYSLIVGFRNDIQRGEIISEGIECEFMSFDAGIYSIREQVIGRRIVNELRANVKLYFFPQYNAPWNIPRNSIVMIYDFIQFEQPGYGSLLKKFAARRIMANAVKKSGRIIAISNHTGNAIARYFPFATDKTIVINPGLEDTIAAPRAGDIAEFKARNKVQRYLLCVGNKKPHKNFEFAIKVFETIASEFPDLSIVIIGKRFPEWTLPGNARIIDVEYVSDAELALWYAGAEAMLHPSLAEGFGLTPLEAMRAGVPAIVSNCGSLPEAVGDSAIVLGVADVSEWANQIRKLLSDGNYSSEWRNKGISRAAEYTWEKSCAKLLDVVREMI
ncbi:MAG: glycosyltransferase family 4 protein [Planctomycetes bacterium]|nr:glycosyltransferase family 4 protein [Planctomycetota bacterium]